MEKIKALNVYIENDHVGTLAEIPDGRIAFEYARGWLETGFSISPFSLPLEPGVFLPERFETFGGLHGVFVRSLPDGFGKRVFDKYFSEAGINPSEIGILNRLAYTGSTSCGALEFRPVLASGEEYKTGLESVFDAADSEYEKSCGNGTADLDELFSLCRALREGDDPEKTDILFAHCGFCGGKTPKANFKADGEDRIIKFPDLYDDFNIGEQEYAYNFCAAKCGIEIPSCRLLPSCANLGYFAVKRFDRENGARLHTVAAGELLELSPWATDMDCDILMRLTIKLTQSFEEAEKLFRLMCFNVFSQNRNNGADNISFIRDPDGWRLAPAYDLSYSLGQSGNYAAGINGNRKNPDKKDLLAAAEKAGLDRKKAMKTAGDIEEKVRADLSKYSKKQTG